MKQPQDQPLNAAQMAQVNRHIAEFARDLKLRQWAMEKAIEAVGKPIPIQVDQESTLIFRGPVELAEAIYKFILPPPQ